MTKNNPVLWTEGLFLLPQHFQQQERYLLTQIQSRLRDFQAHVHGFTDLELDNAALQAGQISILRATGYFADGTRFDIPSEAAAPASLELPDHLPSQIIWLALPSPHPLESHLAVDNQTGRYNMVQADVRNVSAPDGLLDTLELGQLCLRLMRDDEPRQGYICLPVVLVKSVEDRHVHLDTTYIAPHLNCRTQPNIQRYCNSVLGLLGNRIEHLKNRSFRTNSHSSSELGDFLLLQSCMAHHLSLSHLIQRPTLHPELLYLHFLQCLGSLCVHSHVQIGLNFQPHYLHDDLALSFQQLVDAISEALSVTHDQRVHAIPLQAKGNGVYLANITDPGLISTAHFVLTIRADVPDALIRERFPSTVKIGPADRLRDLVNLNLPGVRLKHLNSAPPALPYYADHLYYQLETRSDVLWKQLPETGHLALHCAGEFPGLRLELWAIQAPGEQST
ncbi:type VI secretion system baseplate subunit TssK [Limnobacter humi]|uniref:Type VI secretion system baseplate subunit TssK n=1 Tax=Limnobacter humi TaxID=1778671 RepID=A0ABT1WGB9_9BURK|nr:type VI secretion system baseplate subunit TssK [Limnobacter humi]MCQ8895464.1 type VI secretion system baseplate subunit TssK [Limnobacter humi]